MKKINTLLKTSFLLFLGFQVAQAEKSAFFLGATYDLGKASLNGTMKEYRSSVSNGFDDLITKRHSTLQGFGARIGYNQLFGLKGWVGLRYYGFFDWAKADLGSVEIGQYAKNYSRSSSFNRYGYGAGIDLLVNIINFSYFNLGAFGGVAIGGEVWSAKNQQLNSVVGALQTDFEKTHFDWMFNVGVRSVMIKHIGLEVGAKIPMSETPFLKYREKDRHYDYQEKLKRGVSFYAALYILF
ncbi:outer membrane protein [Helicobacter cetorum]|uniref:Outer membrane protein 8 n=1 Tax=Helicobacter cetorum (strain ATCC BAA-540 / CCUG 52418 / MIT 99-5656) TaxID=1163745 RepID=I0ES34_HELCM|nr:outer membrane protein [Helicobacter cetorum]AFI05753.1 outer membrane protein 8 [Helicobacter cetorum MIT 99-5656]